MKAQTTPNKDVQKEIADLGEVRHDLRPQPAGTPPSRILDLCGMGCRANFCPAALQRGMAGPNPQTPGPYLRLPVQLADWLIVSMRGHWARYPGRCCLQPIWCGLVWGTASEPTTGRIPSLVRSRAK